MQYGNSKLIKGIGIGAVSVLGMIACASGDDPGGIDLPEGGSGGGAGKGGSSAQAGTDAGGTAPIGGAPDGGLGGALGDSGEGGEGGEAAGTGGSHAGKGGTGGKHGGAGKGGSSTGTSGAPAGGEGGEDSSAGGVPSGGVGGTAGFGGGQAGGGTGGQGPVLSSCIYHSDPVLPAGGEGGAAPAPLSGVKIVSNVFLGPYLTDSAGYALYIYGADVPGDCNNPPVSNCYADCAISWPIFNANARELDPGLDDSVFGTIERTDGTFQTTYYGWPLYYYKSDTAPNVINGQNKAKTWFAAETKLPNLMIMRTLVSAGGIKYLSDDRGHTLYAFAGDTLGNGSSPPVSQCTGACLDSFAPFAPDEVFPVTYLEPHDVRFFFRSDGSYQVAFKGAPLYYSRADLRAGEQNGLATTDWGLVVQ